MNPDNDNDQGGFTVPDDDNMLRILADPLTRWRIRFKLGFKALTNQNLPPVSQEEFDQFLAQMAQLDEPGLKEEIAKAQQAVKTGRAPSTPSIGSNNKELIWAAHLLYIMTNHEVMEKWDPQGPMLMEETPLWQQITSSSAAQREMGAFARVVSGSKANDSTTLSFGPPGSWFVHIENLVDGKNHVNIDLFHALLFGMERSRALFMHELGHAELTHDMPDRLIQVREEIMALQKSAYDKKTRRIKFSKEQNLQYVRLSTEMQLLQHFFNVGEDTTVNRYAADQSRNFPYELGDALNHMGVTLLGIGEQALGLSPKPAEYKIPAKPDDDSPMSPAEAQARFDNINLLMMVSFYRNNDLFPNTKEGWERFGFRFDWLENKHGEKEPNRLLNLVTEIENTQPTHSDTLFGAGRYRDVVIKSAKRRSEIIQQIWDEYAKDLAQILIDNAEEQAKKEMDKRKGQNNENGDPSSEQKGDGQPGEGKGEGEGDPSQNSEANGDPSEGGDPSNGNQPGQGNPGEGQPGQGQGQGQGQPNPTLRPNEPQDGTPIDVDGVGEMGQAKPMPKSHKEEMQDRAKQDGITPKEDDKNVGDLKNMPEPKRMDNKDGQVDPNSERVDQDSPGQDGDPYGDMKQRAGGTGGGVDLMALAQGSWTDYQVRVKELRPVIKKVAKDLKQIRDKQRQLVRKVSKKCEKLPEDGDLTRLDGDRHQNDMIKLATGQQRDDIDREKWRITQEQRDPTTVELFIMIDGSGSMPAMRVDNNGTTAMMAAVQAAVILYEAAQEAGFDVFIGMWGNDDPYILASPGDKSKDIGKNLEKVRRDGIRSGTAFSPAVQKGVRLLSEHKNQHGQWSGLAHFISISDGDLDYGDRPYAEALMKGLLDNEKYVTVDAAIINKNDTEMDKLARAASENSKRHMGVIHAMQGDKIAPGLVQLVKNRFRKSGSFMAIPDKRKRASLKRTHKRIMGGPKP